MQTKRIIAKCEQHSGYGAGAGNTEYYEYECPCGKGTIIEEHDNIPGFREHNVYIHCAICSKEYIVTSFIRETMKAERLHMKIEKYLIFV